MALPALQQHLLSPIEAGLQAEGPFHGDSDASKGYHEHACKSMQVWLVRPMSILHRLLRSAQYDKALVMWNLDMWPLIWHI